MQDIYIDDIGKGYPLIMVHGYLGSSNMWNLQKSYLQKYFRIVTPALPGFGESYKANSLDNINDMAKFIFKCADLLKVKKFHLIGHSMGGMIAQQMVKLSNTKIDKLICFATGSIGEMPGRFESIDTSLRRLKKDGIKRTINRIPQKWFVNGKKAKNYNFCEIAAKYVSEKTAANALIAMKSWNGFKNLKKIKNKTLIVWGNKDLSYNFDQVNALNRNITGSRLEIFSDCSHNVHLEQPDKFNQIIKDFL